MDDLLVILQKLRAAEGWLDLGLPEDAWQEMDELPAALQSDPIVTLLRVYALLLRNKGGRPVSEEFPDLADVHLLGARAYARCGHLIRARHHLGLAISLKPELLGKLVGEPELAAIANSAKPVDGTGAEVVSDG